MSDTNKTIAQQEIRQSRILNRLGRFSDSVPATFKAAHMEQITDDVRSIIRQWVVNPFSWSLYLQGKAGRGKSHLAFAIAFRWIVSGIGDVVWWSVPELLAQLRREFDDKRADTIADLQGFPGLLFLDDLGTENSTEYTVQELYRVLYMREAEELKTIVTSPYSLAEIGSKLSPWIMSRLAGGDIIKLKGPDRRIKG